MKKCVITGASSGLGLSFLHQFSGSHTVENWDIQEGRDLSDPHVCDSLVASCQSADVFINNCQVNQLLLLDRVYHECTGILIINVSAAAPTLWHSPIGDWRDYVNTKLQLNQRVLELQSANSFSSEDRRNWIMNLRLGFMNTEQHQGQGYRTMDTGSVAAVVYNLIGDHERFLCLDLMLVPSTV